MCLCVHFVLATVYTYSEALFVVFVYAQQFILFLFEICVYVYNTYI